MAATPLLLQAVELNNFLWRYGPYVRYPIQWNSKLCRFEPEKHSVRNFIWFLASTVSFVFVAATLFFLVTIGLKAPHLDKLPYWILTFELLPIVIYILLFNLKSYLVGPVDICEQYLNPVIQLGMGSHIDQLRASNAKQRRKSLLDFVRPCLNGELTLLK